MKLRMKILFAFIIVWTCLFPSLAGACTIFAAHKDGVALAGNNEDWMYSSRTSVAITAPSGDGYGWVGFCISGYLQGGMNERGLFYDGAICPQSEATPDPDKPTLSSINLGEKVLSQCSSVDEVVEMAKGYNLSQSSAFHLLFADASGNSAVLEWVEGEFHAIKGEGNYQAVTNFWLSKPDLGNYPCTRYKNAEEQLAKGLYSVGSFRDILKLTAQDWGNGGTLYSNVYDLTNRVVYIYDRGKFESSARVELVKQIKEMKPGEKTNMAISELSFSSTGDVSPVTKTPASPATVFYPAPRRTSPTDASPETGISEARIIGVAAGIITAVFILWRIFKKFKIRKKIT